MPLRKTILHGFLTFLLVLFAPCANDFSFSDIDKGAFFYAGVDDSPIFTATTFESARVFLQREKAKRLSAAFSPFVPASVFLPALFALIFQTCVAVRFVHFFKNKFFSFFTKRKSLP